MNVEIYTLDRFEGGKAVLYLQGDETKKVLVPNDLVPMNIREGDIVEVITENGEFKSMNFQEKESLEAFELMNNHKTKINKER